jgi:tetratricopeptide (TPR) repeat protein
MIGCVFVLSLLAQDLERAERAYRQGEFAPAMKLYEEALVERTEHRGAVLFNVGNCAYRLERYAEAVLWYERARQRLQGPALASALTNRSLAQAALGLDAGAAGNDQQDGIGAADRTAVLVACLLQTGGGLAFVLARDRRRRRFGLGITAIGFGIAAQCALQQFGGEAVRAVVLQGLPLRSSPEAASSAIAQAKAGALATVTDQRADWVRLVTPEGSGWVLRSGIGLVAEVER